MHGMDPKVAEHKLNIDRTIVQVQQKLRSLKDEKEVVVKDEVEKLLQTKFIWEIVYPSWLANVVMV